MKRKDKGFTLLELLIVIAIIAILAAFLIWVLNPAETLRKGRDSQRISDLKTLHQALAFYITVVSNPVLDKAEAFPFYECEDSPSGDGRIWTSVADPGEFVLDCDPAGGTMDPNHDYNKPEPCLFSGSTPNNIDGTGWMPVNFTEIPDGSPISRLPIDPVNKLKRIVGVLAFIHTSSNEYASNDGYYYRYTCKKYSTPGWVCGPLTWEIDANLESDEFRPREKTDGGDGDYIYEIGTCLYLFGTSQNF